MALPVDKLRKAFLLLMRSSVPGEVIAARDGMLRLAETENCGPYELADALTIGAGRIQDKDNLSPQDIARRCWDFHEAGGWLSEKEQKFVREMMHWTRRSEKQIAWLESIYARIRGAMG
jgi:hypothetical protein